MEVERRCPIFCAKVAASSCRFEFSPWLDVDVPSRENVFNQRDDVRGLCGDRERCK